MELILTSFLSPILWVIPQGAVHNICSNLHPTDISQVLYCFVAACLIKNALRQAIIARWSRFAKIEFSL